MNMIPVAIAGAVFREAAKDMQYVGGYTDMETIAANVECGFSRVWVEGESTLLVTTLTSLAGMKVLFVDMAFTKIAGAIARNLDDVVGIALTAGAQAIACLPLSNSQQRLYRRYGFVDTEEFMIKQCEGHSHG